MKRILPQVIKFGIAESIFLTLKKRELKVIANFFYLYC